MRTSARLLFFTALSASLTACATDDAPASPQPDVEVSSDVAPLPDVAASAPDEGGPPEDVPEPAVDEGPPAPARCDDGLLVREFVSGAEGTRRHEVAGDFEFTRYDGIPWRLSEKWTGCDVYVFVPDTLRKSSMENASVWENDIAQLVTDSPPNVHYFFVSRSGNEEVANADSKAMFDRIGEQLKSVDSALSDAFWFQLHAVPGRAADLPPWLATVLTTGIGQGGFVIGRDQRLRGLGSLADVLRQNQTLANNDQWPWESNLAYAANDAHYANAVAAHAEAREQHPEPTTVTLWDGEVLSGFEEIEVELPSAEAFAQFDTFEIEVDMRCPNPDLPEAGNCGAWDYLAHLSVYEDNETRTELGRFITAYHRETHWVSDVTPMMLAIAQGGKRTFRWEYAPSWNPQPTETRVRLHFSNRGRELKPSEAIYLYAGGNLNSAYNEAHPPLEVAIPADAVKVELYSVVTGHGADTQSCSEFCNHVHHFTVNGQTFTEDHPAVGQPRGCVDQLQHQMVPNQWGTWWFGRGGWCPGQHVPPWTADVTEHVEPGGTTTIEYRAMLGGGEPPDGAGNILMNSYLIVWK